MEVLPYNRWVFLSFVYNLLMVLQGGLKQANNCLSLLKTKE